MSQDCDKPVAGKKLKTRIHVAPEEPTVLYDSADRWTGMNSNLASMDPPSQYQRLKLIQNTVRVDASSYSMNRGALNVFETQPNNANVVSWNQMSDRTQPHEQVARISMKSSVSIRPGNMSPGGMGCDIKHNSYDRYLARLKGAGPLRKDNLPIDYGVPITFDPKNPIYGGKTVKTSIGSSPCACGQLIGPFIKQVAYSFTYTGSPQLPEYFVRYIPILRTDGATIIYPTASITGSVVTMSVEYAFFDDDVTNDGFTFNIPGAVNFYNSPYVSDLTITTFGSIPLSRGGHQFKGLNVLPHMPINELSADIPTTLPNTSFSYCFANVGDFNGMSNEIMTMFNVSIATDTSFMFYQSTFSPDNFILNITDIPNLEGMFQEATEFNPVEFTMIINDTPVQLRASSLKSGAPLRAPPPKPKVIKKVTSLFKKAIKFAPVRFAFKGAVARFARNVRASSIKSQLNTSIGLDISSMFYGCPAFNPEIFQFDVIPVAMDYVFFGATAFNAPLNNLVVDYVETMDYAFYNASAFDQPLTNWFLTSVTSTVNVFSGSQMITDIVPDYFAFSYQFIYTGVNSFDPLLYLPLIQTGAFTYNTPTITPIQIDDQGIERSLYTISFRYNYNDNGTTNDGLTFANANVVNFYNNNTTGITIINFAGIPFSRAGSQFAGLTVPLVFANVDDTTNVPSILPNTSFNNCFNGTTQFNSEMPYWDTTNAINMNRMFQGATTFNQNISGWNVKNVIFYDNFSTGSPLSSGNKPLFNPVPGFIYSFNYTGTDDAINFLDYLPIINANGSFTINSTKITTTLAKNVTVQMEFVFSEAPSTNDGLSFINVNSFYSGSTTGLAIMKFNGIPLSRGGFQFFNLPVIQISATDTPTILTNTKLNGFIANSGFNSNNINSWNLANLSPDYSYMFWYGVAFNQNISEWNTAGVTNMDYMFNGAVAFNQNIGVWNTGNVTSMINTFYNATAFNRDLSDWDVRQVTIHTDFAKGSPIEFNNSYLPDFP